MSIQATNPGHQSRRYTREEALDQIEAVVRQGDHEEALNFIQTWLNTFPGDLYFRYLQSRSLIKSGQITQGLAIIEALEKADPELADAYRLHLEAQPAGGKSLSRIADSLDALTGEKGSKSGASVWSELYRQSRSAFNAGRLEEANDLVQQALIADPTQVLPAMLHIRIAARLFDTQTLENLANLYHDRWPECLDFIYFLSTSQISLGNDSDAVALLHTAVGRDNAQQVAARIWHTDNPYIKLWPEKLTVEVEFTTPPPIENLETQTAPINNPIRSERPRPDPVMEPARRDIEDPAETMAAQEPSLISKRRSWTELSPDEVIQARANPLPPASRPPLVKRVHNHQVISQRVDAMDRKEVGTNAPLAAETTKDIRSELNRIADRLHVGGLNGIDRRFPVYVILTTRKGLETQYGAKTTAVLDEQMKKVVESIRSRKGWNGLVFYADDSACTTRLGIKPAPANDAWKLKLALADLDSVLSKRGEMIGCLLIVGGPEIVPFHMLPNPTEDADTQIASDNPYGTTDDNYFIPEWPIGRLPGGTGNDAGILMRSLRQMVSDYSEPVVVKPWWAQLSALSPLLSSLQQAWSAHSLYQPRTAFGYTASIWKQASTDVFRLIGDPQSLLTSPPVRSGQLQGSGFFPAKMSYFNLHGTADTAEWYGQPNFAEMQTNPEYPVAFTPADIAQADGTPTIVFSEACYGAHILAKSEDEAVSLKFLSKGTKAMVGSTCIAYGSVSAPLIAADKLALSFWRSLKDGKTAGEALRMAKISLAQEMNRLQGFLDGEDQKTLISFILLGDPMAKIKTVKSSEKSIGREVFHENLITTNLLEDENDENMELPEPVLAQVKSIVEQYLPGMQDGQYGKAKRYTFRSKSGTGAAADETPIANTVVTVSKQTKCASCLHTHYARLTMDRAGKVVKLSVSR